MKTALLMAIYIKFSEALIRFVLIFVVVVVVVVVNNGCSKIVIILPRHTLAILHE